MTALLASLVLAAGLGAAMAPPRDVRNHDNIRPAGRMDGTTLTLRLVAETGRWRPMGPDGPALDVAVFGEDGQEPQNPGPYVHVAQGTTVALTMRNALPSTLTVHGLCDRPAARCDPIAVPAGETREARFTLSAAGTFAYWGSTTPRAVSSRLRQDTQLNGAIVVSPPGRDGTGGVLLLSTYRDPPAAGPCLGDDATAVFAINGASWPHTTRQRYAAGDTVRWRVVNLTCEQHAMHLHGFHFSVTAAGDGVIDTPLEGDAARTGVTEAVAPGRTFALTWVPTRAGNWLFHCHMVPHMSAPAGQAHAAHGSDPGAGMAGLVVGIEVTGPPTDAAAVETGPVKRLVLALHEDPARYGAAKGYRMEVEGVEAPRLDAGPVPGPVILTQRGQPTEITVVNRMTEPAAMHWHGMELESYFDGVPGFGGTPGRISPRIDPGQSFVVRFTPPRAGTFIYHTHWHDEAQLAGGLYGALLVLEPGERYDPSTDHIAIIGLNGVLSPPAREPFALNGRATPAPIRMRPGATHRLRLINITSSNVGLTAFLVNASGPQEWTPVAKDGAALPLSQRRPRAARQQVAVGETYDFEIPVASPQPLWLEVRRVTGEWVLQVPIEVR